MAVSVIIVNFRTAGLTTEAVRSALEQPEAEEIIVVDNASGDDSIELLEHEFAQNPRVTILPLEHNGGFGAGNNAGVAASTSEFVFLLNSDATLHANALTIMLKAWTPETGIMAPRVLLANGTPQDDAFGPFPTVRRLLTRDVSTPDAELHPDWLSGCALLLRRDDYLAVGGFDEALFMYLEDVLLCHAVRGLGKTMTRCLDATVTHRRGSSFVSTADRKRAYYQAQSYVLRKLGEPTLGIKLVEALRWPHYWMSRLRRAAS